MTETHLRHRHGGAIVAVHAIAHDTIAGVTEWHYVGTVHWDDGTSSTFTPISPICLGHDSTPAGVKRVDELTAQLSDYLATRGEWHDQRRTRDGRHYSYTAHKPKGQLTLLDRVTA